MTPESFPLMVSMAVVILDRTYEEDGRSRFERAVGAWKGALSSGVVMREECNGGSTKTSCLPSLTMSSQPKMSVRMKELLHGVRLSIAAEHWNPADELEDLARRIDADRSRRRKR